MWISVTLQADAARAEALSDALMEAGALSVSIEDADAGTAAETPQFGEPGHLPSALWEHSRVIALFDGDTGSAELGAMLAAAAHAAGLDGVPPFATAEIAEQNWVQLTQSQFDPIRITARLWIVPSWHEAPDPGAINIELDPGMAFGTGSHPTTRLCLEWLCDTVRPGCTVLDYGCGSGILGIAAARLGAADVLGVDIDEKAVEAARDNAARNGVTPAPAALRDPGRRDLQPGGGEHPDQSAVRARPGDRGARRRRRASGAVGRARDPGRPGHRSLGAVHRAAGRRPPGRLGPARRTAPRAMTIT